MKFYLASCFALVLWACSPSRTVSTAVVDKTQAASLRYDLLISFSSLEDLKRVPYRFSDLKMELREEVSAPDNLYKVSILCKDYQIDRIVFRLNKEAGINWPKRVE